MRQGEVASKGAWSGGAALDGVKAPEPLVLPDPATRFARTAARLKAVSVGHPMSEWLLFMAQLASTQQTVATRMPPPLVPSDVEIDHAMAAGMPAFGVDRYRRDPAWREALGLLIDDFAGKSLPAQAQATLADLRQRDGTAAESLADGFLQGSVYAADAGAVVFVAAAFQAYFTRLAASLHGYALQLLPQRGLCPCCGSTPVAGVITGGGATPGLRYLYCSLCGTAWNHVRAVCITCGDARSLALKEVDGDAGVAKAETCDECHTYAKMFYQAKDTQLDPFADDLATLGLDVLVAEAGWSRHAPNPLLLIG
jgi:FdhE protein